MGYKHPGAEVTHEGEAMFTDFIHWLQLGLPGIENDILTVAFTYHPPPRHWIRLTFTVGEPEQLSLPFKAE